MFICVSIYALIKDEQFVMIELLIHKATLHVGLAAHAHGGDAGVKPAGLIGVPVQSVLPS